MRLRGGVMESPEKIMVKGALTARKGWLKGLFFAQIKEGVDHGTS